MNTLKNKIVEALKDIDTNIVNMLKMFASASSGIQQALYQQKVKDADSVDIVSMNDVLSKEEISRIKQHRLKQKECYRNAFVTCETLEYNHDVKYVEGYINFKGLPIEHAFVKIDGKYIDPTAELVLKNDITEDTYIKLGEFTTNDVREIIVENGFWGQIYDYKFIKKYKENISDSKKGKN